MPGEKGVKIAQLVFEFDEPLEDVFRIHAKPRFIEGSFA
jgi:hypothetical protein